MSDTPETDAARITEKNGCIATVCGKSVVPADLARRLERERDELRARLEEAEADYKELARHHNMECTCTETY